MAVCIVSYVDSLGFRHTVEVEAESLFEAGALGILAFRQADCEPGPNSELNVEIRSSITHTVTPRKVREWLAYGAKTPKETVLKGRFKELL